MNKILLLIGINFLLLSNCLGQDTVPKNLEEAISYFEKKWSIEEKNVFRMLPENEAVTNEHFGVGLWIRNNWIRGDRDTFLIKYFNKLGIYNPDDISSIILTSLHRKLNNVDLDLEKQIEYYKAYWKPYTDCIEREKINSLYYFNKLNILDTITIRLPVDTSNNKKYVHIKQCPFEEWNFDPDKDLVIIGVLKDKYFFENDSSILFLDVLILKTNINDIVVYNRILKIGEIRKFWNIDTKFN